MRWTVSIKMGKVPQKHQELLHLPHRTPGTPASSPRVHLQTAHIQLRPLQACHPHTPHKLGKKEQIRNKSHNFVYDLS